MKKILFLTIIVFFFLSCKKNLDSEISAEKEKTQKLNQLLNEYESDEIEKLKNEFKNY